MKIKVIIIILFFVSVLYSQTKHTTKTSTYQVTEAAGSKEIKNLKKQIETIKDDIDKLTTDYINKDTFTDKILEIESRLQELNNAISDLNTKVTETQISINNILQQMDDINKKINNLQQKDKQVKTKNIIEEQTINQNIKDEIMTIKADIEVLKKEITKLQQKLTVEKEIKKSKEPEQPETISEKIIFKIQKISQSKWLAPVGFLIAIIALFY